MIHPPHAAHSKRQAHSVTYQTLQIPPPGFKSAEHALLELLPGHVSHLKAEVAGAVTAHLLPGAADILAVPSSLPGKVLAAILVSGHPCVVW